MTGQHLTGRGLPSLRRAVADQWDYDDPSHRRRQPVASELTPIHSDLELVTAVSRVGSVAGTAALKCPLQGESLGKVYGDPGLPSRQDPPLGLSDVVQRTAEQYVWHQVGCRSCRNQLALHAGPPSGLHS